MSDKINVCLKFRPLLDREKAEGAPVYWDVRDSNQIVQNLSTPRLRGEAHRFDHVFKDTCTNDDVFHAVIKPIVEKAVCGFNGTVFAYGQTASGKTFTMKGGPDDVGIIELAVNHIFTVMMNQMDRQFLLRASYIEIYNEKVNDLLQPSNVNLRLGEEDGQVVIKGITEEIASSSHKIMDLMDRGEVNRRIGETAMNDKSSRSHTIFRLIIESTAQGSDSDGAIQVSQLNLVDLAGSEKTGQMGTTGSVFKEGCHINSSLTALGKVIKQLSEAQDYINYRDSKLTRILQASLGGNSLTAIVCTVTPANLDQTYSTLSFAHRAKTIKNQPMVNEVVSEAVLIKRYAKQLKKLQSELALAKQQQEPQSEEMLQAMSSKLLEKDEQNERLQLRVEMLEESLINGVSSQTRLPTEVSLAKRRQTWCAPKTTMPRRRSWDLSRGQKLHTIAEDGGRSSTGSTPLDSSAGSMADLFETPLEDFEKQLIDAERNQAESEARTNSASDKRVAWGDGYVTMRRGGRSRCDAETTDDAPAPVTPRSEREGRETTPVAELRARATRLQLSQVELVEFTRLEKQVMCHEHEEKISWLEAEKSELRQKVAELESAQVDFDVQIESLTLKHRRREEDLRSSLEAAWAEPPRDGCASQRIAEEKSSLAADLKAKDQQLAELKTAVERLTNDNSSYLTLLELRDNEISKLAETAARTREELANVSSQIEMKTEETDKYSVTIAHLQEKIAALEAHAMKIEIEDNLTSQLNVSTHETPLQSNSKLEESSSQLIQQLSDYEDEIQRHLTDIHCKEAEICRLSVFKQRCRDLEATVDSNMKVLSELQSLKEENTTYVNLLSANEEKLQVKEAEVISLSEALQQSAADIAKSREQLQETCANLSECHQSELTSLVQDKDTSILNLERRLAAQSQATTCQLQENEDENAQLLALIQEKVNEISKLRPFVHTCAELKESLLVNSAEMQKLADEVQALREEKANSLCPLEARTEVVEISQMSRLATSVIHEQQEITRHTDVQMIDTIAKLEREMSEQAEIHQANVELITNERDAFVLDLQEKLSVLTLTLPAEDSSQIETLLQENINLRDSLQEKDAEISSLSIIARTCADLEASLNVKIEELRSSSEDLVALKTEIDSLSDSVCEKDNKISELEQSCADLKASLSAKTEERHSNSEELAALKEENNTLSDSVCEKDNKISALEQSCADLKASLIAKTEERHSNSEELAALKEENNTLSDSVCEKDNKISALEQSCADLKASLIAKTEELHSNSEELAALKEENNSLSDSVCEKDNKISELEQSCADLKASLIAKTEELHSNSEELAALKEENNTLSDSACEKDNKISALEQSCADLKASLIAKTEERHSNSEELAALKEENNTLSDSVCEKDNKISELEQSCADLKASLIAKTEERHSNSEELAALKEENNTLSDSVCEKDNKISALEQSCADLKASLIAKTEELHSNSEELAALKEENNTLSDSVCEKDNKISALEQSCADLKASLSAKTEERHSNSEELAALKEENNTLSDSVREKNSEISRLSAIVQTCVNLEITLNERTVEIRHLNEAICNLEHSLAEQLALHQSQIDGLIEEHNDAAAQSEERLLARASSRLDKLQEENTSLLILKDEEILQLQQKICASAGLIHTADEMEEVSRQMNALIEEKSQVISQIMEAVSKLTVDISEKDATISDLKEKLATANTCECRALHSYRLSLVQEIRSFNPSFTTEGIDSKDPDKLLAVLITTVMEKESELISSINAARCKETQALEEKVFSLQNSLKQTEDWVSEMERNNEVLETDLNECKTVVNTLTASLKASSSEVKLLKTARQELREKLNEKESELVTYEMEFATVKSNLRDGNMLSLGSQKRVDELAALLEAESTRCEDLEKRITMQSDQINKLLVQNHSLKEATEKAQQQLALEKETTLDLYEQIALLGTEKKTTQATVISWLRSKFERCGISMNSDDTDLESVCESVVHFVTQSHNELANTKQRLQHSLAKSADLEKQLLDHQQKTVLKPQVANIQDDHRHVEMIRRLRSDVKQLSEDKRKLKETIGQINAENVRLVNQLTSVAKCECADLRKAMQDLKIERADLNGQIATLKVKIMREDFPFQQEAIGLRQDVEDLKERITVYKREVKRLKAHDRTLPSCAGCKSKPTVKNALVQTAPPDTLEGFSSGLAGSGIAREHSYQQMRTRVGELEDKSQQYKTVAKARLLYIKDLEHRMTTLVPDFIKKYY